MRFGPGHLRIDFEREVACLVENDILQRVPIFAEEIVGLVQAVLTNGWRFRCVFEWSFPDGPEGTEVRVMEPLFLIEEVGELQGLMIAVSACSDDELGRHP